VIRYGSFSLSERRSQCNLVAQVHNCGTESPTVTVLHQWLWLAEGTMDQIQSNKTDERGVVNPLGGGGKGWIRAAV